MKRSIDWSPILKPRASRNAPLKKAPKSCARAHPKERSCGDVLRSVTCVVRELLYTPNV